MTTINRRDYLIRMGAIAKHFVQTVWAGHGSKPTSWTTEDLRPCVERALEFFGPRRIMFGSDWPVCCLVFLRGSFHWFECDTIHEGTRNCTNTKTDTAEEGSITFCTLCERQKQAQGTRWLRLISLRERKAA